MAEYSGPAPGVFERLISASTRFNCRSLMTVAKWPTPLPRMMVSPRKRTAQARNGYFDGPSIFRLERAGSSSGMGSVVRTLPVSRLDGLGLFMFSILVSLNVCQPSFGAGEEPFTGQVLWVPLRLPAGLANKCPGLKCR